MIESGESYVILNNFDELPRNVAIRLHSDAHDVRPRPPPASRSAASSGSYLDRERLSLMILGPICLDDPTEWLVKCRLVLVERLLVLVSKHVGVGRRDCPGIGFGKWRDGREHSAYRTTQPARTLDTPILDERVPNRPVSILIPTKSAHERRDSDRRTISWNAREQSLFVGFRSDALRANGTGYVQVARGAS